MAGAVVLWKSGRPNESNPVNVPRVPSMCVR